MAHGGYEPIPEWDDDYDVPDYDDDNADQTGAFVPFSSTLAPNEGKIEFQTAQKEKSGLPKPSFLKISPL